MSKPCIVVDIDGTMADISHRRHHLTCQPKNWKEFRMAIVDDTPNWPIVGVVRALLVAGHHVIYSSGRHEYEREETRRLLQVKCGLYHWPVVLYMRADKDYRADDVVKEEMLNERIRPDGWAPWLAIDDRDRVVAMWRRNGITCMQVAEGDF